MATLLKRAYDEKYAIPAFNFFNTDFITAVIETSEEEKAPAILQVHEMLPGPQSRFSWWCEIARSAIAKTEIPVALHLDHGGSFDIAVKAIVSGCSSVMIDKSALPMAENIEITKRVVDVARIAGTTVEAELGHMTSAKGGESGGLDESVFTVPEEAVEFVKATGIDALAASVGTVHGLYRGKAKIDFDRLQKINKMVKKPLVLHGGTGIPDESLKRTAQYGVTKVNVATALGVTYFSTIQAAMKEDKDAASFFGVNESARQAIKETIRQKIRLLGCNNRL